MKGLISFTMLEMTEIIRDMYKGNVKAVLSAVKSEKEILVMNAIIAGVHCNLLNKEFIDELHKQTENNTVLMGHHISNVAIAALDILKIKKYEGDESLINRMIETKLSFK